MLAAISRRNMRQRRYLDQRVGAQRADAVQEPGSPWRKGADGRVATFDEHLTDRQLASLGIVVKR